MHYSISFARDHFQRLTREAELGGTVIVTRNSIPIVRVLPLSSADIENVNALRPSIDTKQPD
jgi:antitoxin (DNA-binding transcriptional repressor) of toxin-antitoxin stability system